MINTIRTVRIQSSNLISSNLQSNFGIRKASAVKFRQLCKEPASEMENKTNNNPNDKNGDVMSHSFGEGYATRADDEGFGGIYGDNQRFLKTKDDEDQVIHEIHPVYDKSQGSEVKEKEKARHQTNASSA